MPDGLFHLHSSGRSISKKGGIRLILINTMFYRVSVLNANCVDPDQTPRSAASDLGLHYLPMSLLWDARLTWVNYTPLSFHVSFDKRSYLLRYALDKNMLHGII